MHALRALRSAELDRIRSSQVARVLPADPARQVELAQGIIHGAFRQAAAQMTGELQHLRAAVADKDGRIRSLEDSLAACQDSLQDARSQVRPVEACMRSAGSAPGASRRSRSAPAFMVVLQRPEEARGDPQGQHSMHTIVLILYGCCAVASKPGAVRVPGV